MRSKFTYRALASLGEAINLISCLDIGTDHSHIPSAFLMATRLYGCSMPKHAATSTYRSLFTRSSIREYSSIFQASLFDGKHIIVTGGSRGIGYAIAKTFASLGASCILIGRQESTLKDAVAGLSTSTSASHEYIQGDISQADFWSNLSLPTPEQADSSRKPKDRRIDVLVNAAGITHSSLLLRTTETQINDVIQTNLMGTLWASRAMGKKMLRQTADSRGEKGCIINISSLLATHGGAGSAAYAASKAGVTGITRALAAELGGSGIRLNAVLPGYIETDMTDGKVSHFHVARVRHCGLCWM